MLAIVVSRADSASAHVGERLLDLADWRERTDSTRPDGEGGGTVYRLPADETTADTDTAPAVELREFDDLHLELTGVADAFGNVDADDGERVAPDLLVFASRHAGETGELLTAHHTGNFGPADYGGDPRDLARACPNAHRRVLAALRDHAPESYEVGTECTHHGPTHVGAPSMFVEVGSGEPQWADPAAARAVANAILDLRGVSADAPAENDGAHGGTRRQLVGFGGGHYAPRFERIERETDWAVGHVAADWGIEAMGDPRENRAVVDRTFAASGATHAVVDGDRSDLVAVVEDLGYRVVSETWVRETSGVHLALVDRVESRLGSIDEGVRFGERAGGSDSHREFAVVDLPADLLAEARGVDADRAWDAVAERSLAFTTEQDGTQVGFRAALANAAERRAVVEALAAILEDAYDEVQVREEAVVAERTAFDPEKARALGISEGPAFGKLSAGEAVEVGGRTIPPEAVHEERTERFPY